jgi:hypothetical protein
MLGPSAEPIAELKIKDCRHHPRGSVRRASGFVLTGYPEIIRLDDERQTVVLREVVCVNCCKSITPKNALQRLPIHLARLSKNLVDVGQVPQKRLSISRLER